jgi:hypothetical protein
MKYWAPIVAAIVGWTFTQLAFPGSAADCRLMYGIAGAVGGAAITAMWLWMPHLTPATLPPDDWYPPQYWYPPQQSHVYHGPYVDQAWAEGQRERARLMWLDGTPVPPTDFYGARG